MDKQKVEEIVWDYYNLPGNEYIEKYQVDKSTYWNGESGEGLVHAICQLDSEECPECRGKGGWLPHDGEPATMCELCQGTGRVHKSDIVKVRGFNQAELMSIPAGDSLMPLASAGFSFNDLLPYMRTIEKAKVNLIRQLNPNIKFVEVEE